MQTTTVEYLSHPEKFPERPPVTVVYGDEAFLRAESFKLFRSRVLTEEGAEFSYIEHDGSADLRFADIVLELSSPPMFGGDVRLVRITDADRFVTGCRDKLINYLTAPSKVGLLLLQVRTLIKTSALYKAVDRDGLLIEAKQPGENELVDWLKSRVKTHKVTAKVGALRLLISLLGDEPGILDGEIQRLALLIPPGGELTEEFVSRNVGSWRLQKAWDIIALALAGDFPKAIHQLEVLLASGEQPIAVLAQMGAVLRKYWVATELFLDGEHSTPKQSPGALLSDAVKGAKIYAPFSLKPTDRKHPVSLMKQLGRHRGARLANLLLQADLDLKGGQRIEPRIIIETLLAELSAKELRSGAYLASKRPLRD